MEQRILVGASVEHTAAVAVSARANVDADRVAPAVGLAVDGLTDDERASHDVDEALDFKFAGNPPLGKVDQARDLLVDDGVRGVGRAALKVAPHVLLERREGHDRCHTLVLHQFWAKRHGQDRYSNTRPAMASKGEKPNIY